MRANIDPDTECQLNDMQLLTVLYRSGKKKLQEQMDILSGPAASKIMLILINITIQLHS